MEDAFGEDYAATMRTFKSEYRDDYEGEYTFIVKVGIFDNRVEIKETVAYCKLTELVQEVYCSEEDYKPESNSESESVSDADEKRRRVNRESVLFDPETQVTRYNTRSLPTNIPVIEIDEKPSETKEYHWIAKYESVPSNSPFNSFLNHTFKQPQALPSIMAEFQGVRYRYLRVGTNNRLNTVRQYNQFVIGNNFTIFRLGINGSPNVNLGVNARAREKRFPLPINKKFTIASLFWANELLKSQKAW